MTAAADRPATAELQGRPRLRVVVKFAYGRRARQWANNAHTYRNPVAVKPSQRGRRHGWLKPAANDDRPLP